MAREIRHIFVMTGAGVSAPSGIQTFRGSDGLWNGHKVEEVATPWAFEENPNRVHEFYNDRRDDMRSKKPNAAHLALGRLYEATCGMSSETELDIDCTLITQNIDDLHERGGVEQLVHMHGDIYSRRCVDCWHIEEHRGNTSVGDMCPHCSGKIRPHIVWFGESPFGMEGINLCLEKCDLFVSIGTSGLVAPACNFVEIAKENGAQTLEFNLERTAISHHFDECVLGDVTDTVPQWIDRLIEENKTKHDAEKPF